MTCETVAWPMFVRLLASLSAIDPHCGVTHCLVGQFVLPVRDVRAQPSRRMALRAAKFLKVRTTFTSEHWHSVREAIVRQLLPRRCNNRRPWLSILGLNSVVRRCSDVAYSADCRRRSYEWIGGP